MRGEEAPRRRSGERPPEHQATAGRAATAPRDEARAAGGVHEHEDAEQQDRVADAEHVVQRQRGRRGEDVAEELELRVLDHARVDELALARDVRRRTRPRPGWVGMTPPLAAIAMKFSRPPSAMIGTPTIRRFANANAPSRK